MTRTFPAHLRSTVPPSRSPSARRLAFAGAASADPKVLAKVDGSPITEDNLNDAMADIGPGLPQKLEGAARQKYVLDYLIDLKLAAKKAQSEKLDQTPEFARKLDYYRDKLAMEQLLGSVAKAATTEEAERKAYEEAAKAEPPRGRDSRAPYPRADRGRGEEGARPDQGRRGFRQGGDRTLQGPFRRRRRSRLVHQGPHGAGILRGRLQAEGGRGFRSGQDLSSAGTSSRSKAFAPRPSRLSSRSRIRRRATSPRRRRARRSRNCTARPKSRCSTPTASLCRRSPRPRRTRRARTQRRPRRTSRKRPDAKLFESRPPACSPIATGTFHGRSRSALPACAEEISVDADHRRRPFRHDRGGRALRRAHRRDDGALRRARRGRRRVHPLEMPLRAGRLVPRPAEEGGKARALIVNSGNANAFTGHAGIERGRNRRRGRGEDHRRRARRDLHGLDRRHWRTA